MSADVTLADCRIYADAALAAFARALLPECIRCCNEPAADGDDYCTGCRDEISHANENARYDAAMHALGDDAPWQTREPYLRKGWQS